jgi:hypothetical protein
MFLEKFAAHERNDSILEQTQLLCRAKTGFGLMRLNGQIILQPVYQGIRNDKNNLFEVKIGGSWGIVDKNGEIIVKPLYPHLDFTAHLDLYLVAESVPILSDIKERYSLIRQDGRVLLNSAFGQLKEMGNRMFAVESFQSENGLQGIFHAEKGWIYDTLYHISRIESNYFILNNTKTKRSSLIDQHTMQPILPAQYDTLYDFVMWQWDATQLNGIRADTFLFAAKAQKWGLFELRTRKWILPLEYDFLTKINDEYDYDDSFLMTLKNGVWNVRNSKGQVFENQTFTHLGKISNGYFGQRGDSVLFFTKYAFPVPIPIEEAYGKESPLIKLHTFDDKTLVVNQLQKVVVPTDLQIVSLEGNHVVVRDTVRNLQFLMDEKRNKMVFLPKYEILHSLFG